MVRVRDLDASLRFFRDAPGLVETRRKDYPQGRFTLVCLGAPANPEAEVELLQHGDALAPKEPWLSMPNVGSW